MLKTSSSLNLNPDCMILGRLLKLPQFPCLQKQDNQYTRLVRYL